LIGRFRLTRLGLLLKNHKKGVVAAEDAYKKALAIDQTHAKAWYNFGILLDDKKDVDCHPADSQIIPHNSIFRINGKCFFEGSFGTIKVLLVGHQLTQIIPHDGIFRINGECFSVGSFGTIKVLLVVL